MQRRRMETKIFFSSGRRHTRCSRDWSSDVCSSDLNDSYKAIGLILKSYLTSVLTDEFGDVPYTEAWLGSDATPKLSPVYDTQESIYVALLDNLATNADNVALIYLGSNPNNHPINENRKTRDDHRVSNTIIDYLYTDAPSPDYRVVVYAELAGGDWVGLPNGMTAADALNYLGNGMAGTSKKGK